MKQVLNSLNTGAVKVVSVPTPQCGNGDVLVKTSCTLVSAGTEKMLVDFGKANFLNKARQQPEKVRMAFEKIKTDGLKPTIESIFNKLDQPLPLGYCNVGRVIEVGQGVRGINIGDRVVTNGKHAEIVSVPKNLCVKIPDSLSDNEAVFTVLGAIALQGIRLANPTLGETIVVTGLGLVGLITVQLLIANGCRVMGIDFDPSKVALAKQLGAEAVNISSNENPHEVARSFSRGHGVDAVIITATTKSNNPVHQAALMCRKRGRIILVGVTGLELNRADFYEKELSFQVSCSYGPGRYDPNYEEKGIDYPIGFVRWTEQRNFEAVLDIMSAGRINVGCLISHQFNLNQIEQAYSLLDGTEQSLGIVLNYSGEEIDTDKKTIFIGKETNLDLTTSKVAISFIGAGNYATSILIPAFKKTGAFLKTIISREGVSAVHAGKKYGFENASTDSESALTDKNTTAIVITTRHNSHANFVISALKNGKHVFVEKPLCLNLQELDKIESIYNSLTKKPILTVGFNRRFAPQVKKIKTLLEGVQGPKSFTFTVNAGAIPLNHWSQDIDIGGGRLIGEACHYIDLLRYLVGAPFDKFGHVKLDSPGNDTFSIIMSFSDGSIATLNYFANGPKSVPKERLEVFAQGAFLELDNFRKLRGQGWPDFRSYNLITQDKGQKFFTKAFVDALKGTSEMPIPIEEIFEVTRVCIELTKGNK